MSVVIEPGACAIPAPKREFWRLGQECKNRPDAQNARCAVDGPVTLVTLPGILSSMG